jgi:peptidoglycan hydrolase-like protein with peptidoglycan-binding domain
MMVEAGTTGEPRPEQKQLITTGNLKLVQERLKAEGVYAGPVDGEMSAQTEAALRGRLVTQSTTSPKTTMTQ